MIPPFELVPFEEMKIKQVEQYFIRFVDTKEERIQNLQNYIQEERKDIDLDKSPELLIYLWDWFQDHIEWEERYRLEIVPVTLKIFIKNNKKAIGRFVCLPIAFDNLD